MQEPVNHALWLAAKPSAFSVAPYTRLRGREAVVRTRAVAVDRFNRHQQTVCSPACPGLKDPMAVGHGTASATPQLGEPVSIGRARVNLRWWEGLR